MRQRITYRPTVMSGAVIDVHGSRWRLSVGREGVSMDGIAPVREVAWVLPHLEWIQRQLFGYGVDGWPVALRLSELSRGRAHPGRLSLSGEWHPVACPYCLDTGRIRCPTCGTGPCHPENERSVCGVGCVGNPCECEKGKRNEL